MDALVLKQQHTISVVPKFNYLNRYYCVNPAFKLKKLPVALVNHTNA